MVLLRVLGLAEDETSMIRAISLMAMTAMFLSISPNLRESILGGYNDAGVKMAQNSPYSYIALGLGIVGGLMIFLYKASQPR
jgi:hypothetical protein